MVCFNIAADQSADCGKSKVLSNPEGPIFTSTFKFYCGCQQGGKLVINSSASSDDAMAQL